MTSLVSCHLFLDTSVIFGRIFEHENLHVVCRKILTTNNQNYTSETVRQELQGVLQRRKEYHTDMINLRNKRIKGSTMNQIIDTIAFNDNDNRFLRNLKSFLLTRHRGLDWLGMYRTYLQTAETLMDECFDTEIQIPLIIQSTDPSALNEINAIIQNLSDCQILLDMIYAFKTKSPTVYFVTKDKMDFIDKKSDISNWFCNFFKQTCFFHISHVLEIVKMI